MKARFDSSKEKILSVDVIHPSGVREGIPLPEGTFIHGQISRGDLGTDVEFVDESSNRQEPDAGLIPATASTVTGKASQRGSTRETTIGASLVWPEGKSEPELPSPISPLAGRRSPASMKHWQQPKNARELAAQMSKVATMLLNGEIDREVAHQYTQMMRPTVQAMSAVVYQARAEKTVPDLSLDDEDLYEEE